MGNIYLMTSIIDRRNSKKYYELFQDNNLNVMFWFLGFGTASNKTLDYLGLDNAEKAIAVSVVEEHTWIQTKKQLEKKLKIDAPGGGISFIIPLSSVAGKKALQYLIENSEYQNEEETSLKNTTHELIVTIAQQGYTDLIMDAARAAGAYGGTVLHAKGTGTELAEKFMHISLAEEKEVIYIVTKTEQKNEIMQAIMTQAGPNSKAKAITFSLPVTDTAGLRLIED